MQKSWTLVIETSCLHGSIGLAGPNGTWQQRDFISLRSHNSAIFAPLSELLADLKPGDIGQILVGSGPGSYNGARVGMAAAQGIALIHNANTAALPSYYGIPLATTGPSMVIGDARRGDWWHARLVANAIDCLNPTMTDLDTLNALLRDFPGPCLTLSEQRNTDPAAVAAVAQWPLCRDVRLAWPQAASLWKHWQGLSLDERAQLNAQALSPLYLKPPHVTAPKPGHPLLRHATKTNRRPQS